MTVADAPELAQPPPRSNHHPDALWGKCLRCSNREGQVGRVSPLRRVIAHEGHEVPRRPAIRLVPGDKAQLGERDDEWPEFVFVTTAHGAGWVPRRHLSEQADHSGQAVVRTAYDTTELRTEAGQVLQVVAEDLESGWLWCRAGNSREGWVPVRTVRDDPSS